jgi:hypothetical protein
MKIINSRRAPPVLALVVQARSEDITGQLCAGADMALLTGLPYSVADLPCWPVRNDPAR